MADYTTEQLQAGYMKAKQRGDTDRAKIIADEIERRRQGGVAAKQERVQKQVDADRKTYSPAAGAEGDTIISDPIAGAKNLAPAIGSGMTSVLRAVGGGRLAAIMGLPSTKEDATQLDAPLQAAPGGSTGTTIGQAAPAALAIPFTPATIPGAAAAGLVTGGALTEGGIGDRAMGAGLGALGGAVGGALPAVVRTGRGIVRGALEPLRDAGRERIVGRTLERFAENPDQIAQLLNVGRGRSITGAQPTLAEALRSPGIASLERAMTTDAGMSEAAAQLAARQEANNAARIQTLRAVAGQGDAPVQSSVGALRRIQSQQSRRSAEGTRAGRAAQSYGQAYEAGIVPGAAEAMAPQIEQLMSRPSVQAARAEAQSIAAEKGLANVPENSVQGLHFLKQALDDQALAAVPGSTRQGAIKTTSGDLASTLEELSPLYQGARREYQYNSVPVTRAEIGERLLDAGQGAIRDMSGNRTLQAQKFSTALNDEAKLIKGATGYKGTSPEAALSDTMAPWQVDRIGAVRDELELLSNLGRKANGPGSQTAKMLSAQNLMRQVTGPLGLPEGFVSNAVSEQLQRLPTAVMYRSADQRVGNQLAEALLDPSRAADAIRAARAADFRPGPTQLNLLLRRMAPAAIGLSAADASSQ